MNKPGNIFDGNQKIELTIKLDPALLDVLQQLLSNSLSQEEKDALTKLRRTSRQLLNKASAISTAPPTN